MKNLCSILFCLILFSCNNAEDKKPNDSASSDKETPTISSSRKEADSKSKSLVQKKDYSSLFNRERGNCDFINAEGMATAINTTLSSIEAGENSCTYFYSEANGNKTRFYFMIEAWGNKTILKEIKTAKKNEENFGKDSKLSQYRISETGDTYLSMHQNRMVRIINEKSENVIIVFYTTTAPPTQTDASKKTEQKDLARKHAYAIANYLLNTHKQ